MFIIYYKLYVFIIYCEFCVSTTYCKLYVKNLCVYFDFFDLLDGEDW